MDEERRKYLLQKMGAFCAYRERHAEEIRQKMRRMQCPPEEIDYVLGRLEEEGLIDEARYARAFAHDRFRFHQWGRIKIDAHLREKGIDRHDRHQALQSEVDPEAYRETLYDLLQKKLRQLDPALNALDDPNIRAKMHRYAAQKGYEAELVRSLTEQVLAEAAVHPSTNDHDAR